MTVGGWIMLGVSWTVLLWLAVFCLARVLRKP